MTSLFLHFYRFQLLLFLIPLTFSDSGFLVFQTLILSNVSSKNFYSF